MPCSGGNRDAPAISISMLYSPGRRLVLLYWLRSSLIASLRCQARSSYPDSLMRFQSCPFFPGVFTVSGCGTTLTILIITLLPSLNSEKFHLARAGIVLVLQPSACQRYCVSCCTLLICHSICGPAPGNSRSPADKLQTYTCSDRSSLRCNRPVS